jgi:hypothetical protein
LWLYHWRAFWLERNYGLLQSSGPAVRPFAFSQGQGLIFIQGFWRTGTTLLHELLTELPGCAAPCTWQCMDPSSMLAPSGKPVPSKAVQRPMDQVMITADSPQEDEFALMAMGVPSVYRGFLDPRRLPELKQLLEPAYWTAADPDWMETLQAFLAWCWKPTQKIMVLKSPNHVFRFPALSARFPRAQFAWVFRKPAELWRSNLKMWHAMIARYGLWAVRNHELEDFLEAAFSAYGDLLEEMHNQGGFRCLPVFSYETLVDNPASILPALVDRLGLGPWEGLDAGLRARMLARPKAREAEAVLSREAPTALLARLSELQNAILFQSSPSGIHLANGVNPKPTALSPSGRLVYGSIPL